MNKSNTKCIRLHRNDSIRLDEIKLEAKKEHATFISTQKLVELAVTKFIKSIDNGTITIHEVINEAEELKWN